MFLSFLIPATLFWLPHCLAAPAALGASALLQNARDAQALNEQFTTLTRSDPCNSGDTACIGSALATCSNGTWATKQCLSSQKCFALPSVSSNGTHVTCTSEASALSIMQASGVQGIFASNCSDDGTAASPPPSPQTPPPPLQTAPAGAGAAPQTVTVTQIMTLVPGSVLTLPPVTRTLAPADASSLLSSLAAAGFTAVPAAPTGAPDGAAPLSAASAEGGAAAQYGASGAAAAATYDEAAGASAAPTAPVAAPSAVASIPPSSTIILIPASNPV